jgi:hypothetical protein
MPQTATYVYCLAERSRPPSLVKVPSGLPSATSPCLIEIRKGLWAIAADVPLSIYGADRLEPRLKDINWVADLAIAHEAVVEHFASRADTAVVPMKLLTMFSSHARAAAELAARWPEIKPVLARIRGCREWGVRVTPQSAPARGRTPQPATSGTAFLAAKKRQRDDARAGLLKAADAAETTLVTLAKLARATNRREAPESATSPPLVDAAFLVVSGREARFRTTARRLAKSCRLAGADMILTGPWPPYNFVQSVSEPA